MRNNEPISQQISLFCSLIQARRFDDGTLRILQSVLITRDVKSLLAVRQSLKNFMRDESLRAFREINEKSVDHKLLVLDFLVRVFALTGDQESCLSLRYEALVFRELNSVTDQQLHVSHGEWLTFAEHALEYKFYAIARKACEKALACFQTNDILKATDANADASYEETEAFRKVKRLKDIAIVRASSQSVQAQAFEYLKRKIAEHDKASTTTIKEKQHSASYLFRNGIKKHNTRKLQELQRAVTGYHQTT